MMLNQPQKNRHHPARAIGAFAALSSAAVLGLTTVIGWSGPVDHAGASLAARDTPQFSLCEIFNIC